MVSAPARVWVSFGLTLKISLLILCMVFQSADFHLVKFVSLI